MLALVEGAKKMRSLSTTAGTTLLAKRERCLAERFISSVLHAILVCPFALFLTGFNLIGGGRPLLCPGRYDREGHEQQGSQQGQSYTFHLSPLTIGNG